MKRCTRCGLERPESMFNKHRVTHDRLQTQCRPCMTDRQRELRERQRKVADNWNWRTEYLNNWRRACD